MRPYCAGVLLAVCAVGCEIRKVPDPPKVELEPGPHGMVPAGSQPSPVVGLSFRKLWDPDGRETPDATAGVMRALAARHLAKYPTEHLAPATVGAAAAPGGWAAAVGPAAFAIAYPAVVKDIELNPKGGLARVLSQGSGSVDSSTSGTGGATTRHFVLRVKDGTDADLGTRFGEFVARLEGTVNGSGATIMAHQRGAPRPTGPVSGIRYEAGNRAGFVRSVVIRGADGEFESLFLGDEAKGNFGGKPDLVKSALSGTGPYLVVFVKEQKK